MEWKDIADRIILTNVPNYYVTDENCENLYYKAIANEAAGVLIGPSSMSIGESFEDSKTKTFVAIAYPSGAAAPDIKAQEIQDCERENKSADAYFVTAAVGYYLSGHEDNLREEMRQCVAAVDKPVYFITESAEMPDESLKRFCEIGAEEHVAGIILTTAFIPYDFKQLEATDVARVRKVTESLDACVSAKLKIIAAGIYRTPEEVGELLHEGADAVIINDLKNVVKICQEV